MMLARTGAALVVADPPWSYSSGVPGHGRVASHYDCLQMADIVLHLSLAWDCAAPDAYLLLWVTFPLLKEWMDVSDQTPWKYKSGGAWAKDGLIGTGYHWRGQAEAALLYVKGKPKPCATIRSAAITRRSGGANPGNSGTTHSEKPLAWCVDHVRAFCPPDGYVMDLYAGMSPYARACHDTGRRYVGAEIDPARHAAALGRLANHVSRAK